MRFGHHACLATALAIAILPNAQAWYGPVCYPDSTRTVTLTLPSITGENPGDIRVDFDDNDHRVSLTSVRASASVPNAHEITLSRNAQAETGTFAIILTSPRSNVSYKFEMEFRKNAAECQGAVIRVSGSSGHENTPLSGPTNSSQAAQPNQTVHRKAPRPAQTALASTPSKLSTDSTLAPALAPPQSSVVVPEEVTAPSSLKTAEVPASVSSGVAASLIVQKASDAITPLSLKPAAPSPGSPLTLLEAPAQLAGVIAIPEKVESPGPVQPTLRSVPSSPSAATTIEPAAPAAEEASTTSR